MSDVTVVTEVNFVFTGAVDNTGMLTISTTPSNFDTLTNCPMLQVRTATVVLFPTVVFTEQLDPELGMVVHPFEVQVITPKLAVRLPFRTWLATVKVEVTTTLLATGELRLITQG